MGRGKKKCILEGSEKDVQPMASSDWPPQYLSEVHLGNLHRSNVKRVKISQGFFCLLIQSYVYCNKVLCLNTHHIKPIIPPCQ